MTKLTYDVYIAGAMHGRTVGEVLDERASAKALCEVYGLTYYDPAADEGLDQLSRSHVIDLTPDLERMEFYVQKDDSHVDLCRMMLVLTGDISTSGTAWEMGRMHYRNRRSIVIVAPKMFKRKLVNFTTVKADWIRPTQEEAISLLSDLLEAEREDAI